MQIASEGLQDALRDNMLPHLSLPALVSLRAASSLLRELVDGGNRGCMEACC